MSRSSFEPPAIPEDAWLQEAIRHTLRERNAGELFRFAQKYGISQMRLAALTGQSQGRINDLIHGRRGNITAIDAWERIADGLDMPDPARVALGLAPTGSAPLAKAVTEVSVPETASALTAGITGSDTNEGAIEQLARATATLAESHTRIPAEKLLVEVLRLHNQTRTLLDRRQRLSQKRELFQIESNLLAHACLLFGDLQRNATADEYGAASLLFAQEAGASEAISWTARAKTLRWQDRFIESADMARQGFDCSPSTPIRVQLASQEANAAALMGDASRAREALKRANEAAENVQADSGVSAWSFPVARQAIFALSVSIHTNDPDAALQAAAMADAAWKAGTPHVPATWAQIRAGAAIAHLMKGSLDGAIEEVTPALALPAVLRVATVTAYLYKLDERLNAPCFAASTQATSLRQQIQEFNSAAPALGGSNS